MSQAVVRANGGQINDLEYCKAIGFAGVLNGYYADPLFGGQQMFFVISQPSGGNVYQLAYGYNSCELRGRKYESGKWSNWL